MNLICGDCSELKIGEFVGIKKNRFNREGLIDVTFGNSRRRFFCFNCGRQHKEGAACAVVYAAGEDIKKMILPADEHVEHWTECFSERR